MTREEIKQKTSLWFLLNPNIPADVINSVWKTNLQIGIESGGHLNTLMRAIFGDSPKSYIEWKSEVEE